MTTRSYTYDETIRTVHPKLSRPGETWTSGTWVARDDIVFTVRATADRISASALVPTPADAAAIAARFPKSAKIRASHCVSSDWDGYRGTVDLTVKLSADAANQGVNETGLRRYRAFTRRAAQLGYMVTYQAAAYAGSLTETDFTTLITT